MQRLAIIAVTCMLLAAILPVTATDRPAGRTVVVSSTADSGAGTFRQALEDQRPYDIITFDPTVFPADRKVKIAVKSELPHIQAGNVTIDGSDSWVVLDGRDVSGGWTEGLMVVSDGNTIQGLQVSRFPGPGIVVSAATGNLIGGDRAIGSGPFGQGNLVTRNNAGIGLWSDGVIGASGNVVTGNLVGADASGRQGHGNLVGVMIVEGAHDNTIGPDNIITRNDYAGVRLDDLATVGNAITRNSIHHNGVGVNIGEGAHDNTIGPDNIITRNGYAGVRLGDLATVGNAITRNSIHHNGGPGIALHRSAHAGVVAPTILSFDLAAGSATGATCPGCTVEVYSGKDHEGAAHEGSVTADERGRFAVDQDAPFKGPHLTATTTDPQRGTSEFSVRTVGKTGERSIQAGNDRWVTQLEPKSSAELDDNRMGTQFDSFSAVGETYDYEIYPFGVKRARIAITGMEPEHTDWDRSEFVIQPGFDAVIDRLVANGVAITYVLMFWDMETWPGGEGAPCARFRTKGEIERYLDFVRFTVEHFKDRVDEWEIWNEPDIKGYCPKYIRVNDYVRLVKRTVPVIRAEHPDAKIVVGGVSGTLYPDARKWLYALLGSDVMPLVDVVTWHPMYGASPAVEKTRDYYRRYPSIAARIKRRAEANGFRGEYRADEISWATPWSMGGGHHRAYEPTVAAKYFGRGILLHLGMDIGVGVGGNNHVTRNLATLMAGAEPSDVDVKVRTNARNVVHYSFTTSDGGRMVAIWSDGVATEGDSGKKATVRIEGVEADAVSGIDVLHGYEQPLTVDVSDTGLVIRRLVLKDYPIIIRVQPRPVATTAAPVTAAPPPAPVTSAVFAGEASEGLTLTTGDVDTEIIEAGDPPE